ncbi:c-type cytochrome [Sphingobium lignivorans]|uniref:Cytochrome c2 n=1 Tax=Sphingobium lignivorans TaxID=2735886 RepID=A0ABR6NL95_9SPHN|nr:c-type cytochrome [Sphingobium lignivorans]MBB5986949.1 cytochrome c2 [Sphingobium lignivorans]
MTPPKRGSTFAAALALALAGCGQQEAEAPKQPGRTALPMPAAFAACQTCHSIEPGAVRQGPSLAGLADRKPGTAPNFASSEAIKGVGERWTAERLSSFLYNPGETVPGNKMMYGGTATPEDAQEIARYVLSLP